MRRYEFVAVCPEPWPIATVCRVVDVSTSGYYQWRKAKPAPASAWQAPAPAAFTRHAGRYGTRRLRAELRG